MLFASPKPSMLTWFQVVPSLLRHTSQPSNGYKFPRTSSCRRRPWSKAYIVVCVAEAVATHHLIAHYLIPGSAVAAAPHLTAIGSVISSHVQVAAEDGHGVSVNVVCITEAVGVDLVPGSAIAAAPHLTAIGSYSKFPRTSSCRRRPWRKRHGCLRRRSRCRRRSIAHYLIPGSAVAAAPHLTAIGSVISSHVQVAAKDGHGGSDELFASPKPSVLTWFQVVPSLLRHTSQPLILF